MAQELAIVVAPPKRRCRVHGDVDEFLTVWFGGRTDGQYCLRCWVDRLQELGALVPTTEVESR